MHAIELEASVNAEHEIHLALPAHVPPGKARLILLFEESQPSRYPSQFPLPARRIFGQFKGQGTVPEDFNEPLPESFWTGESQ